MAITVYDLWRLSQLLRPPTFRHRAAALLITGSGAAPRRDQGTGDAGAGRAGAAWQGLGGGRWGVENMGIHSG